MSRKIPHQIPPDQKLTGGELYKAYSKILFAEQSCTATKWAELYQEDRRLWNMLATTIRMHTKAKVAQALDNVSSLVVALQGEQFEDWTKE